MIDTQKNIERFEKLYAENIKRDGADKLLEFIRKSDFYIAPASTRFHLNVEGGLLQHSLNVYDCLANKKKSDGMWGKILADVSDETIAIVSLLHDLCKTYFYFKEPKNQKVYDPDVVASAKGYGVKHDAKGDYVWRMVDGYSVNNKYPLGHGSKSVFFIQQYLKLTIQEMAAIYWHMGAYCDSSQWSELGDAMDKYPLVLALQEADMEASHILEVNN